MEVTNASQAGFRRPGGSNRSDFGASRSSKAFSFVLNYWFAISTCSVNNSNTIRYLAPGGEAEAGNLMPDYIYLLENRLSADQRNALSQLREVARGDVEELL